MGELALSAELRTIDSAAELSIREAISWEVVDLRLPSHFLNFLFGTKILLLEERRESLKRRSALSGNYSTNSTLPKFPL